MSARSPPLSGQSVPASQARETSRPARSTSKTSSHSTERVRTRPSGSPATRTSRAPKRRIAIGTGFIFRGKVFRLGTIFLCGWVRCWLEAPRTIPPEAMPEERWRTGTDPAEAASRQGVRGLVMPSVEEEREGKIEAAIGKLQQSVQALIDGDLILASDGCTLLAQLETARRHLTAGDTP